MFHWLSVCTLLICYYLYWHNYLNDDSKIKYSTTQSMIGFNNIRQLKEIKCKIIWLNSQMSTSKRHINWDKSFSIKNALNHEDYHNTYLYKYVFPLCVYIFFQLANEHSECVFVNFWLHSIVNYYRILTNVWIWLQIWLWWTFLFE